MKRLLVFVLACLASTTMFAQYHYTVDKTGCAGTNTTMTCYLYIDHVVQEEVDGLEIGVFDIENGGLCRGRALPKTNVNIPYPFYQITIKGNEGFTYTFKIYNHNTEEEMTLVPDLTEEIYWESGKAWGRITKGESIVSLTKTDKNSFSAELEASLFDKEQTIKSTVIYTNGITQSKTWKLFVNDSETEEE